MKNGNSSSIRTRLTFYYSLTTFALVTILASFLYFITTHILYSANYQFVTDEIKIIKKLLENKPDNHQALEQEVVEAPFTETGSVYHYYLRILDANQQVVLQTPHIDRALEKSPFFTQKLAPNSKQSAWWDSPDKRNYLLMQATSFLGKTQQLRIIQVALDISYQENIISKYRNFLLVTLLGGLLFAILCGYFISYRAMRSLDKLTETAQKITASSLHQRIDPQLWPQELKSLGMAFNQMLERIETAFSHLLQFSADLAHELRTPINNLLGETEIVLSRPHSLEQHKEVLESNLEELHRISQIIENLLFLARTENPQLSIVKETLNVTEEIKLIAEFYQAIADEKNITVSIQGHATLRANLIMFRRMISNILSNALKYTPEKGLIKITITATVNEVIISIEDNGIGIAAEHLPHIFNRFYRVDTARSQQSGGTGLGLAIVKSIAELHHATLSMRSELGQGTMVLLHFPK